MRTIDNYPITEAMDDLEDWGFADRIPAFFAKADYYFLTLPATDAEYDAYWAQREDYVSDCQGPSWATEEGVIL